MVGGIHIKNKEDFGYLLWKLEALDDFYPCYEQLIHNDKQKTTTTQKKP